MVDKFGRSAHKRTQNISAEGASLSYINDNFIRNNGSTQMTGTLNMGNNKISNVHDPVDSQDVVTKNYIENQGHVLKSGDTMIGDLNMSGNVIRGLSTVRPVTHHGDEAISWGQAADFIYNSFRNLPEPTEPTHATTKNYVDRTRIKPVISIMATERGPLTVDRFEWNFANERPNENGGYVMTSPGRLVRLGLKCVLSQPEELIMVALTVNGNTHDKYYNVTQLAGANSGTRTFETPLELNEGDVINFISASTNPYPTASYVTALIELDL